ncbi:MAG: single-strand DNA-binding protein [Patiriisocius sp.]|jgi:single-strand DNA-binding protein
MAGINKVILVGNMGKDPEVRHLEGGSTVASFSVATSETFTDRRTNERITQTEWHNVVAWRKTAEFVEKYLGKGRQIYVEGKLKTRNWTDKEGVTRYTTEIVADVVQPLGARPGADGIAKTDSVENIEMSPVKDSQKVDDPIKDDLPF